MREYNSVTQAIMGISDHVISDFDVREANGTLPIIRDGKRIAYLTYSIKSEVGKRKLDYSMQPYAAANMEQSLGILVKVADQSSPPQSLSFDGRNIHCSGGRDFFIKASEKYMKSRLDTHSSDKTVRLAAVLLGSNPKSLQKEIDSAAQEHRRRFPTGLGTEDVSQTLYGSRGFLTVTYSIEGGPDRRIFPKELSSKSETKLNNRRIADELVRAFGDEDWRCRSDNTLAEAEEHQPRLVVSFWTGPSAVFTRPGPGASRLQSVPTIVSNHDNLDEAKMFDRILAGFEPFVKKI